MANNLFNINTLFSLYSLLWLMLIFLLYPFSYKTLTKDNSENKEHLFKYLLLFFIFYGLRDTLNSFITYAGLNVLPFFANYYLVHAFWVISLVFLHLFTVHTSKYLFQHIQITYKPYLISLILLVALSITYGYRAWQISTYLLFEVSGIIWLTIVLSKFHKRFHLKNQNIKPAIISIIALSLLNSISHFNLSIPVFTSVSTAFPASIYILAIYSLKCLLVIIIATTLHKYIFSLQKKPLLKVKPFFITIAAITIIISSTVNLYKNEHSYNLQSQNQHSLMIMKNMWETHVGFANNLIASLSKSPVFYTLEEKEIKSQQTYALTSTLERYCKSFNAIPAICYFLNNEGRVVATSTQQNNYSYNYNYIGMDFSSHQYFKDLKSQRVARNEIIEFSPQDVGYIIPLPVYNLKQNIVGIVAIKLEIGNSILKRLDPTLNDSTVTIVDDNGKILRTNKAQYSLQMLWSKSSSALLKEQPYNLQPVNFENTIQSLFLIKSDSTPMQFISISSQQDSALISFIGLLLSLFAGILSFMRVVNFQHMNYLSKELADRELKFRLISENSSDFIFQLDMKGHLTYCSSAVIRELRYDPEEVIGTNFTHYIVYEDLEKSKQSFQKNIEGHKTSTELGLIAKDGRIIQTVSNAGPLRDENGEIKGVQGHIRNNNYQKFQIRDTDRYFSPLIDKEIEMSGV
ncbi:MAG: PAS domain S-box protein [Oligoflexia bacterium]|nr:PAS domain S-box protein [Oligoflexia bacterium]